MSRQRSYTDREKAEALATVDMLDGNVTQASRMTGIPGNTLAGWVNGRAVNRDVPGFREEAKMELSDLVELVARETLESMRADGSLGRANYQQKAIAFGILTEKMLLLRGQPTTITADVLSEAQRAERVAYYLEVARQRQAGLPAGDNVVIGTLATGKPDDDSNAPSANTSAQPSTDDF